MEIKENDYIHSVIYGELPDNIGNILFTFLKREGKWMGEYRYRTYSKIPTDEDSKTFYGIDLSKIETEEELKNLIDKSVMELTNTPFGKIDIDAVYVGGTFEDMLEKTKHKEWMSVEVKNKQ